MTEIEKYQAIQLAETKEELKTAILNIADEEGQIFGREKIFKAESMAERVELCFKGYPLKFLTRNYGIRQQALYIMYYEELEKIFNIVKDEEV